MPNDNRKPPSITAWIFLLTIAAMLAEASYQEPFGTIAGCLLIAGSLVSLWSVGRWLGHFIGSGIGQFSQGLSSGFQEGRADAQRQRREREQRP